MNLLVTEDHLRTERQTLHKLLRKHGFDFRYADPICRGEVQRRYTIRRHLLGDFVAWFCWYAEPAVCRPHTSRLRREHHVAKCITDDLTRAEVRLIEAALLQLMHLHPVTSG